MQAWPHPLRWARGGDGHPPPAYAVGRLEAPGTVMRLIPRQFLQLAAGGAALSIAPCVARAQGYPARPVRIVVSYPAGNASDIIGRVVAQALSERLGQRFIVENRPGVSGTMGTGTVAKAAPDGY